MQLVGCLPIQIGEENFPYQFVLKTRADDQSAKELLKTLQEKYGADAQLIPTVNVVSARGDEVILDRFGTGNCGQNIGIPESVYRKLTGKQLGLTGEKIYIIYQQVSSDKAHPMDYATIRQQSVHFGSGYRIPGVLYLVMDELFHTYEVQGAERNILLGYLGKGYNENIVVFSDEYFRQITGGLVQEDLNAKFLWQPEKNLPIDREHPESAKNYPDSLALIKVNKEYMAEVETLIEEYEENLPIERKVITVYDTAVKLHYNSDSIIREQMAERTLRLVTCTVQYVLLFFVLVYLLYLSMNEDYELKQRQFEFLRCLGVAKKDAADAILFEASFTAFVPAGIGAAISLIYVLGIPRLRAYTTAEWGTYLLGTGVIWLVTWAAYLLIYRVIRERMKKRLVS